MPTLPISSNLHRLYDLMTEIKKLTPWEWMTEQDIFGVQNPETNEYGFVSVMGQAGEHYAIAVYLGAQGLYGFWTLQDATSDLLPEMILQIPQLQASFEDREELHSHDRDQIKKMGLKFRGRQSWPMFRSYRPGFLPWFLDEDEFMFLEYVLEQTLDVAPRFRDKHELLDPLRDDDYLIRVCSCRDNQLVWKDTRKEIAPPAPTPISLKMNMGALKYLQKIPVSKQTLEIDMFISPIPAQESGSRPYYPYMLLAVDSKSGMILGHELLTPLTSLEAMWGSVPQKFAEFLAQRGIKPAKILTPSSILYQLLGPFCEELEIVLQQSDKLPMLEEARNSLTSFIGGLRR